jgi:hypothetical protein
MKDTKTKVKEEMEFQGSLIDQAYQQKMREAGDMAEQSMPGSGIQAGLMTGMRVMNAKDKALAMYTAKKATEDSVMGQRMAFIGRYNPMQNAAMVGQGLQASAATAGNQWQAAMQAQGQAGSAMGSALGSYATYLSLTQKPQSTSTTQNPNAYYNPTTGTTQIYKPGTNGQS